MDTRRQKTISTRSGLETACWMRTDAVSAVPFFSWPLSSVQAIAGDVSELCLSPVSFLVQVKTVGLPPLMPQAPRSICTSSGCLCLVLPSFEVPRGPVQSSCPWGEERSLPVCPRHPAPPPRFGHGLGLCLAAGGPYSSIRPPGFSPFPLPPRTLSVSPCAPRGRPSRTEILPSVACVGSRAGDSAQPPTGRREGGLDGVDPTPFGYSSHLRKFCLHPLAVWSKLYEEMTTRHGGLTVWLTSPGCRSRRTQRLDPGGNLFPIDRMGNTATTTTSPDLHYRWIQCLDPGTAYFQRHNGR